MSEMLNDSSVVTRVVDPNRRLLEADEPVLVHFPGLLDSDYCDRAAAVLRGLSLSPYEATTGSRLFEPIPKLGPALFEYHDDLHLDYAVNLTRYFDQAKQDSQILRNVFADSQVTDPLHVIHELGEMLLGGKIGVATEQGREYFSGVVRDINGGALPHYDDASVDTPSLTVGRTDRQLSLLLYLTDFSGGGLTSYDKKPTALDNRERQLGYGYDWSAVQGSNFQGVVPLKGSVVVFNPRFIHSVAPIADSQRRITVSSFIGRSIGTGDLISWS